MTDPSITISLDTQSAAAGLGYLVIGTGLIGTGTIGPSIIYQDVATDVRSLSISRGMGDTASDIVFRTDAGQASLVFDNRARSYDQVTNAEVLPGRAIQITATYNATTYYLFTGKVDAWRAEYPANARDAVVTAAANDGIASLSQSPLRYVRDAEKTGTRITRLANIVEWDVALQDIDTGTITMCEGTATASAWSAMQEASVTELGQLYVEGDGVLTFRDLGSIHGDARSTSSQATFGDSGGELKFTNPMPLPNDTAQLRNEVTMVYNQAGDSVTASDADSQASYGVRSETLQVKIDDPVDAANQATFLVTIFANPVFRIGSIDILPQRDPTNLWPQVLGRKIGDRITVAFQPPGGGSRISQECFIFGISHDIRPGLEWRTRFVLTDATYF